MRDRMERFVVLPFSMGCVSHSSIDVASTPLSKKPKIDSNPHIFTRGDEDRACGVKMKNSWGFVFLPKPHISHGIQKLLRGFKSFSHLFVYKEEEEEEEKMEIEMEIGLPTDVKHVTHIGWDGSTTTMNNPIKGWDNLKPPDDHHQILPFPSISLRQFELAMAAQADHPSPLHLNNN